jgi:hypothetical protein
MSLKRFLELPDVRAAVKPLRPPPPRKIDEPIQAEPRSARHTLVGTAFDYLLRFELQRRAPHAVAEEWVAETACDILWRETSGGAGGLDTMKDIVDPKDYLPPEVVGQRARAVVEGVKTAVASYLKSKAPTPDRRTELAAHAIRLAKLDQVVREFRLDPGFEEAAAEDVEDLLGLLEIVPFDSLVHRKTMLLNPTFGESSLLVGGADADLIAGDLLVDFKVTKQGEMQADHLDQLLGYYLLARRHRRHDPSFPEIKRVALYFARHGFLWERKVAIWADHPDFARVEAWFFERAGEIAAKAAEFRERRIEQVRGDAGGGKPVKPPGPRPRTGRR